MADLEDNQDFAEALSQTQVDQGHPEFAEFFQKLTPKRKARLFALTDRDE
jgi:hypothetical protein